MTKSKIIVKDAAQFTIGGYISTICNFVSATIVRKILDPFFMGVYTELALIFEYAKYTNMGMIDSLDRQIPYYNGKKDLRAKEEVTDVGASFSFFVSFVCAVGIIIIALLFRRRLSGLFLAGLDVIAILVVVQTMSTFYVTIVRTHHLFGALSRYIILIAAADVFFKALLGIKFGVIGILWATLITFIIGFIYLFRKTGLRFKIFLPVPAAQIKALLGIGFPLLLASFAFMVLRSMDRLMIIAFLTKDDLGFYSIAIMLHSFIFQLPNLIYTVLFPRFYEAFGVSRDIGELKGFLEKPTLVFAYLFPLIIGMAVIVLPVFINYILPKYAAGVASAYILLFGTFFISITNMSGYMLIALKKQNILVLIGAVSVAFCAVFDFIAIKFFGLGIVGIAVGTSLGYFLYSLLLIEYSLRQYMAGWRERIRFLAEVYIPILWVLVVFLIFTKVFRYTLKNFGSDLIGAAVQIFTFLIATSPLLIYLNKKTDIYVRVKNAGLDIFRR